MHIHWFFGFPPLWRACSSVLPILLLGSQSYLIFMNTLYILDTSFSSYIYITIISSSTLDILIFISLMVHEVQHVFHVYWPFVLFVQFFLFSCLFSSLICKRLIAIYRHFFVLCIMDTSSLSDNYTFSCPSLAFRYYYQYLDEQNS